MGSEGIGALGDSMPAAVQALVRECSALWWGAPPAPPARTYSTSEQQAAEGELARFLGAVTAEVKRLPRTEPGLGAVQERLTGAFVAFARTGLGLADRHLSALLQGGFVQAGADFARRARQFDPQISGEDIFQALRNVWTMNGLQVLLGLPVRVTPAVFAYSMLYPYTDNYLDDPAVAPETKLAFDERFRRRLEGEEVRPENTAEQAIFDLVAMIEGQYERPRYPLVHASLRAIHRAQDRSIGLVRPGTSPYEVDVLGISLEKGGASVLADGYLVAGDLSTAQARFLFDWGAFVQLVDDLQDVVEDERAGRLTVFAQTAHRWPLDAVTTRTLQFGAGVLAQLGCFTAPGAQPLKELMQLGTLGLVTTAAGQAGRLYSRKYLDALEARSPFRFSFMAQQRKKMAGKRISLVRLVEAMAGPAALDRLASFEPV